MNDNAPRDLIRSASRNQTAHDSCMPTSVSSRLVGLVGRERRALDAALAPSSQATFCHKTSSPRFVSTPCYPAVTSPAKTPQSHLPDLAANSVPPPFFRAHTCLVQPVAINCRTGSWMRPCLPRARAMTNAQRRCQDGVSNRYRPNDLHHATNKPPTRSNCACGFAMHSVALSGRL